MTQKLRNCQICGRKRGIFVIFCGICRNVDKKQICKCQYWPKKTTKMLHKNKACFIHPLHLLSICAATHSPFTKMQIVSGGYKVQDSACSKSAMLYLCLLPEGIWKLLVLQIALVSFAGGDKLSKTPSLGTVVGLQFEHLLVF